MTSLLPCRRCIAFIIVFPITICLLLHYIRIYLKERRNCHKKKRGGWAQCSHHNNNKKAHTKSMSRCVSDVSASHISRHSVWRIRWPHFIRFYLFDIVPLAFKRVHIRTHESTSTEILFKLRQIGWTIFISFSFQCSSDNELKIKSNLSCRNCCQIYLLKSKIKNSIFDVNQKVWINASLTVARCCRKPFNVGFLNNWNANLIINQIQSPFCIFFFTISLNLFRSCSS